MNTDIQQGTCLSYSATVGTRLYPNGGFLIESFYKNGDLSCNDLPINMMSTQHAANLQRSERVGQFLKVNPKEHKKKNSMHVENLYEDIFIMIFIIYDLLSPQGKRSSRCPFYFPKSSTLDAHFSKALFSVFYFEMQPLFYLK